MKYRKEEARVEYRIELYEIVIPCDKNGKDLEDDNSHSINEVDTIIANTAQQALDTLYASHTKPNEVEDGELIWTSTVEAWNNGDESGYYTSEMRAYAYESTNKMLDLDGY